MAVIFRLSIQSAKGKNAEFMTGFGGSGLKLHLGSCDVTATEGGPSGRGAQGLELLAGSSARVCRVGDCPLEIREQDYLPRTLLLSIK